MRIPLRRNAYGVTLIELMIALVLGLLVIGAAIGIFVSNKQVFRTAENLSRVQENARVGYELMARELRQAGGNPCSRNSRIVNVLNPNTIWGTDWGNGVRGYTGAQAFGGAAFGTAGGARVAGTDAIELRSGEAGAATVVDHLPTSAQFKVSTANHGLQDGDIVMVCDFVQASIFQITGAQSGINVTVTHNSGTGTPGNCSKGLGWADPPVCTTLGTPYAYGPNSVIARLRATAWYIGVSKSDAQRRSLYQVQLTNSGGVPSRQPQEIAEGVHDMKLQYLMPEATDYVDADNPAITDWNLVSAVRVVLTMQSNENVDVDGTPLTRDVAHVVTLRNRNL
ncbi:PilW family protein [Pseudoxanthomonas wuyuanensis]|nr:PilW family protein [Pseudoxanthomonas wuyuanensis]KAF1720767.1 hypothetical protein CSC75_10390 [Pseudoxanthomonas wuyuanensis]